MDSDNTLDYLTVITARKFKDNALKLLLDSGCYLIDVVYAKGSVQSGYFKDMLGLVADEKKVMITCMVKSNLTPLLMEQFVTKLKFDQPNTGIAYVIPVEKLSVQEENMTDLNMNMKALYIVVNVGFAEKIVEYIRSYGSCGATIINARRYSFQHKEIMGINTDKEKEIILTIIDSDAADRIMNSIKQYSGFKTEAHGICYTLPVSSAVGLGQYNCENLDIKKQV